MFPLTETTGILLEYTSECDTPLLKTLVQDSHGPQHRVFVQANKGLHDGDHFPVSGKSPLSLHTRLNVLCGHFLFPLLRINTLSPHASSLLDL